MLPTSAVRVMVAGSMVLLFVVLRLIVGGVQGVPQTPGTHKGNGLFAMPAGLLGRQVMAVLSVESVPIKPSGKRGKQVSKGLSWQYKDLNELGRAGRLVSWLLLHSKYVNELGRAGRLVSWLLLQSK